MNYFKKCHKKESRENRDKAVHVILSIDMIDSLNLLAFISLNEHG